MKNIDDINAMSEGEFIAAFGDVAEHSPWVAQAAARERPFMSRAHLIIAFADSLVTADRAAQLDLIRAHPDLATRARLTPDSTREQSGVGLDSLTEEEFARFTEFNDLHKLTYGFPFIFAVKGATKHQILAAFAERIGKSYDAEFAITLEQVQRIIRFRLEERVAP
ncbi:MAG TPA: 2-oxo-4-hydroxy-4-carboxy-5-ureidoimidazoline decarboxylase [Dongiaceae bacterium]|nr:2-oxo-4-hydroxy-4-carboxy-5-ureidoimidazoline decarboxylase [Dongiaceae bacterium]